MRSFLVLLFCALMLLLGNLPQIIADASADVSAECWAHLAQVQTHNTSPAADRRYHLERGEPSPCTEADAQQSQSQSHENTSASRKDDGDKDRDGKSRFCRKRWWC